MPCIRLVDLDDDVRRTAIHVRHQRALIRLGVDELHALARKVVQAVDVLGGLLDITLRARLAHPDNSLEHVARTVLDELANRVQVGREVGRGREDTLMILALRLVEQLLEPLAQHDERGLVVDQDLHGLALLVQDIAQRSILRAIVVRACQESLTRFRRARHRRIDIHTGSRHRQQADRGQYGETAADVVRHDKGLVALIVRQLFECAARLVGRGEDAVFRAVLAVLVLTQLFENAERDRRLGRGTRLGDDIDTEVAVTDNFNHIVEIRRRDIAADKVNLRDAIRADAVVHLAVYEFDRRTRAQIGAADADHDQDVAALLDLLGRRLDARELLLVIVFRQVDPSQKVVACTRAGVQCILRRLHQRRHICELVLPDKTLQAGQFQFHCHSCISPFH